jgi:hypothetical protein
MWFLHFPSKHQVTVRCPNGTAWVTYNEVLFGGGIIHNATACSTASKQVQALPELHRTNYANLDTPALFLPNLTSILAAHEVPQIEEPVQANTKELDIKSRLATPLRSLDVDTLLHIRQTAVQQENHSYWHLIITTTS